MGNMVSVMTVSKRVRGVDEWSCMTGFIIKEGTRRALERHFTRHSPITHLDRLTINSTSVTTSTQKLN